MFPWQKRPVEHVDKKEMSNSYVCNFCCLVYVVKNVLPFWLLLKHIIELGDSRLASKLFMPSVTRYRSLLRLKRKDDNGYDEDRWVFVAQQETQPPQGATFARCALQRRVFDHIFRHMESIWTTREIALHKYVNLISARKSRGKEKRKTSERKRKIAPGCVRCFRNFQGQRGGARRSWERGLQSRLLSHKQCRSIFPTCNIRPRASVLSSWFEFSVGRARTGVIRTDACQECRSNGRDR